MLTNIKRQLNEIHGVYEREDLNTVDESLDDSDLSENNEIGENSELSEDDEMSENSELNENGEFSEELDSVENRRKLRLRWQKPGRETIVNELEFLPELHKFSIETRLSQYHEAYAQLPAELRKELDTISEELKKFGYSLQIGEEKWYLNHTSVFDTWTSET